MLIEAPYKQGDIVIIKLGSGEELIAKFVEDSKDNIKIDKPMVAIMSEKGMALMPFLMTCNLENSIELNKSKILCVVKPVKEIHDHYIQTTTGITLGI